MDKLRQMDWDLEEVDTDIYSSNIHPYPAKFIPHIPDRMVQEFTEPGDKVLDPFNGSGNTTMMASIRERKAHGCDLNPLACMIARAKVRDYDIEKLEKKFQSFLAEIERDLEKMKDNDTKKEGKIKKIDDTEVKVPDFPDRYDWFVPEVVNQIGALNHHISNLDDKSLRCFFTVNMSAILKRVSRTKRDYTFIGDNMIPTSDSNSMTPDDTKHDIFNQFKNKSERNISRIRETMEENPTIPNIMCGDFREKNKLDNFELVVTSPPYACAIDYARYHRLSFYWLGFPLKSTRDKEIGARSKRGRKNAVKDYLDEMKESYKKVHKILNPNGKFVIVIGDSQRKKEELEVPSKTLKMCKSIGFHHVDTLKRELHRQSMGQKKIQEEKIIIIILER